MSKDTNNKKPSSTIAPQEDKFSYINNLVNNSNKILNNKAISEESKKYSSLFDNSLTANQLGKTQELLPGDVKNITGGADYEKVQDILGQGYNIFDGSLNVRKALGDKQSGWAQAGGAINQAIVGEIVGGTIESTGRLLDIKGSIDLYNGNIKEFDNFLTEIGSGLKGWAEHSTPIFGSEEMLTSGWLAKGLVTTASSLSMLIPAMGAVKVVGGLGRAVGVLKSMETLSTAGRTAAWLRTGISQAVVSRHMENWLEAREVWDNTLNEYVNNKGLSLEEAEQAASKAVRHSYLLNTAMLIFDIPQYVLMGRKTFGSSEASNKIMAALGKSKSSILGSRAKSLGINMASEGFEEAYQYVVGNEVVNYQMYKDGLATNPLSDKFLSGYMKDNDFWTSVIFGALGAGVHSGVGKMINKAFYSKKLETNDNLRIENFKKTQEIQKRIYNKLAKAYESNNQEAVESAIEELTYLSALNSYEFGNSDIALETMGMIKNSSNEELVAMGLPEDKIDEFKANIDNAINQTKDIFKKLKKNSKIFGDEVNKEVTTTELQLEKIDRLINNSEKSITEKRKELEKSQDLKNLSPEEQQILENKLFIDGGKSRITAIDEVLQKNNKLTEEQRINLETQKAEIEQLVKEKSKSNKELVTGLTGSSYLGNVFSDKGLSSISTLFDEEFNSISASVNDNNVSSREEYLSSLDKSKRENLESLEKRLDVISKIDKVYTKNKLYTAELQKELAKNGVFKFRQRELQKNLDYYTSEKYLKEKKQIIDEIRKKQTDAANQAINDEKVADDTINSKTNQNKKANEAETTTVPGFNEIVENLNNKVQQKTKEQGYDAEVVDFVNQFFNAGNEAVNQDVSDFLDKNKIYNLFYKLENSKDSEISGLEEAILNYAGEPTRENFDKIKTLAKNDNSYNKESDVFKAEEAIKEIENQAEEEVKAEVIAAKKVVAINQSNEIPETTNSSVETNVLDENEDVFESDIREYKKYDERSSGAVSVEPTSLAWRSSSAMDNLEEDNDVELTKFLENPFIDITEFSAEFEIDEDYLNQNKTLLDKLNSGETLTQEDINNVPIKVYFLNKEGNRVKNRNNEDLFSYLHANDFWSGKNIQSVNPEDLKKELAIFKFNILKKLNNNEKAISKITNQKDGVLQEQFEMVLNPATNVKERKLIFKPLNEAIALDENEIEFLFGDSFNNYISGNSIDQELLQHTTATPGALYIKFKKPNGTSFPARVFVRRLDNNDVNALFSILNYAYAQNQTLKTEISKLTPELQKQLNSSQFVKDLISVLGPKATLLDVLNNFVYEGKMSQGKGLNELRKVGNDVFINGNRYNVLDFTNKQDEIKAELAKKMINISAKKLNQASYKKILIDNNVVQTHIRLKKGYVTPFSTPTTVISNRLEGDSTNQSSDVNERFDDESTQTTQAGSVVGGEVTKPTFENVPILTRTAEEIETAKNEVFDNLNKLEVGSVIENSDGEIKVVTEKSTDKKGNQLIGIVTYERQEDGSLRQMTNIVWASKSADGKIKLDYNPHSTDTNSKGERVTVTDQITDKKIDLSKENIFIEDENGNLIQINKVEQQSTQESALASDKKSDIDAKKADIEKRRQEELFNILSKEDKQIALKIPEGDKRNKWVKTRVAKTTKGTDAIERHNAEDALNNSTDVATIIAAKRKLESNQPFNSAAISDINKVIFKIKNDDILIGGEKLIKEQYDAELAKLNESTKPNNKADEIKADIERLEKEKQDLLNQPNQESEVKEVTPSKVDTYLSTPNQDGSFNSSSARMSFIPGASIMAFESIGDNKFAVYISKNDAAVKLALQYIDRTIDPVFDAISAYNIKAKEIQVIKPAIVELQGDKYVLVEKGLIDYDSVGINKSTETKTKPDTSKIDAQIAQKQAELKALEEQNESTQSNNTKTDKIKSDIERLEKEKQDLLNQPSQESKKEEKVKKTIKTEYLNAPSEGGTFTTDKSSTPFYTLYTLEDGILEFEFLNNGNNALQALDSPEIFLNLNKVTKKIGYLNPDSKIIYTIKRGKVSKQGNKYTIIEPALITTNKEEYENYNTKLKETKSLPDTSKIDAQIAQKQAELKALEEGKIDTSSVETKQKVVEDKNVIDKDNENEKNKLRKIEEDDISTEFDDFDPESAFSTKQTPQKTDSNKLNEAVEVLNKILPKEVAITLQDDLIKIFENGDAAVASFSKAGIILSSFADDTDAYHEAFHAVFRLLLSGKERNSLIESSKNDFLEPTDEQIKMLMDRHNLSKEEATDLYYEEILADEFGKYMSNPNEYTFNNKEQKSFFEKLLSWINNILGIKSNREKVFSSIRKGDYSNSKQAKDSLANLDVNSTELAMFNNEVNYMLKSVEILQSDKAKQVFAKAEKNNWDLNKTLTELQIPKEQKQLILDLGINNREQLALELASKYSYAVKVNTAKEKTIGNDNPTYTVNGVQYVKFGENDYRKRTQNSQFEKISKKEFEDNQNKPTQIYSNLTVPGGTNYIENEISTPLITPSIKGHAQFATDNGIGWFRSDDRAKSVENSKEKALQRAIENENFLPFDEDYLNTEITDVKTRRILEVQSDLFQKGRDKEILVNSKFKPEDTYQDVDFDEDGASLVTVPVKGAVPIYNKENNQFLQLLNKDNNWVTFFVKSIIQDSAKKGYEKVLFPSGNTASKVEGHTTLEDFKRDKENRLKTLETQYSTMKNVEYENVKESTIQTKEQFEEQKQKDLDNNRNELTQLKQELKRVETEGFGALKPIYNFYENTVTNILNKTYGKDNVKVITDEYGNTWNEVTVKQSRDLSPIVFKTKNRIVESKSEQLSYSNYFEARMNKPGNPLTEQQFNSLSLTEQEVLINQTKYC